MNPKPFNTARYLGNSDSVSDLRLETFDVYLFSVTFAPCDICSGHMARLVSPLLISKKRIFVLGGISDLHLHYQESFSRYFACKLLS